MNERVHRIEALLPAELDAQRLLPQAAALWRDWGLILVAPQAVEEAAQRAALERLGEALYGAREAVARVEVDAELVAPDGARWEVLSAEGERLLARRLSDGALASFHQPRGPDA